MNPYEKTTAALFVLRDRICGETWALPLYIDLVPAKAVSGNKIIEAAIEQVRRYGATSIASIAQATGAAIVDLSQYAKQNADTSLELACQLLRDAWAIQIEAEWSTILQQQIASIQADQIATRREEYFRHRGYPISGSETDGKQEFETQLANSLMGIETKYAVSPPLACMREFVPYHKPGDYIIFAGRPGMGKSYIGLNYAHYNAKRGTQVAVYNLENSPSEIPRRVWSMESGIEYSENMKGKSEHEHRKSGESWEVVKKLPIIYRNSRRNIDQIISAMRRDVGENGISLAVVDYVQLIRCGRSNKTEDVAEASAQLREFALQNGIVVVALAQLNRAAEVRGGSKRPQLADLRNAGDLEQDAVMVGLLYRPEYYGLMEDEEGKPTEGVAEIDFAKGRNTGTGLIRCRFDHIRGFYDTPKAPANVPQSFYERNEKDIPF